MKTILIDNKVVPVCEDCNNPIQSSSEVPEGFVSPESNNMQLTNLMGLSAIEVIQKVVCQKCYLKAFKRVYPEAPLPHIYGGESYKV